MRRGRVRDIVGDGGSRRVLDRARVAAAPAGAIDGAGALDGAGLAWLDASLPNTAAGALRAAGAWQLGDRRAFDAEDWWWRVPLADARAGDRLELGGIATSWDAWLDGVHVARGDSMFAPAAVTLAAPAGELVIRCRALDAELARRRPRPRWRVPMLEQQQLRWFRTTLLGRTPGWSPSCPAVGPWRPIAHVRGGLELGAIALDARFEDGAGVLAVDAQLGENVQRATLIVRRGDERHAAPLEPREGGRWTGAVAVARPVRWWPHTHGEPARYEVALEVAGGAGGDPATIELGSSGFRTIALDRGAAGDDFALHVNGVPVFCRGACWTPLDPVTLHAPAAAYDAAVAQARAAGMNMLRVGGTMIYEDDALYDALDAHGILLWHDLMFANMDYPDDDAFARAAEAEADVQLARLAGRPCVAVVCGNSEGAQQAAMAGAERARWTPPLFHEVLAARARAALPGVPYVASSTEAGAFPHEPRAGASSYYGVGAYLRGLDDARRAEVRFASECLAFANIPSDPALPRVHDPRWKAGSPRDLGAGWDFDDVRDHYVRLLYGIDPFALRAVDHERYLALGRAATGEVMARAFAEWRRARSVTRGALVWFLRDLVPGAGWGLVDAAGAPKPCWYALRRALAPQALAITDEGTSGLAVHVVNDRPAPLVAELELAMWRAGDVRVRIGAGARAACTVEVPAHGAIEIPVARLLDAWVDLSFAYRFGPPVADVVHATLVAAGALVADAFWFPGGLPAAREPDVGLAAQPHAGGLAITARRFAQSVAIEARGGVPDDNYFHLAPGQTRVVALPPGARGTVGALNAERTARFEVA